MIRKMSILAAATVFGLFWLERPPRVLKTLNWLRPGPSRVCPSGIASPRYVIAPSRAESSCIRRRTRCQKYAGAQLSTIKVANIRGFGTVILKCESDILAPLG